MDTQDISVKQKLIEVGRKEFLRCGYEKASMRHISTATEVTTGAIYFFFENKAAFFRAIVEDTAVLLKQRLQAYAEGESKGESSSADNDTALITFLFEHKEEALILLEKAEDTIYAGFRSELCEILEDAFMVFYKRFGANAEDSDIVKIIVRMRIQGYLELLHGDYTMEQALKYSQLLA